MPPRIRTIKPETWKDEKIGVLSHSARLLRIGMQTIADDEGRFRALTSGLVGDIFPYEAEEVTPQIPVWVAEIRKTGAVLFYKVERVPYGAIRHWAKHQKINRPSPSDLPPPPDKRVILENGLVEIETEKGDIVLRQRMVAAPETLSELSLNAHGKLTEDSVPSRVGARRSDPDPVVVHLCERLGARVRANDPRAKADPLSDRWLTDMRLLLAERGNDSSEVERVIDWCQSDAFWRSNILSPAKLRKQFTALLLRSQEQQQNVVPITDGAKPAARFSQFDQPQAAFQ